jgi:hypothetical protein
MPSDLASEPARFFTPDFASEWHYLPTQFPRLTVQTSYDALHRFGSTELFRRFF